jgi:hypothetical protein
MKDIGSGKRASDKLEGNDKQGEVWRVSRISVVLNWLNLNLSLAGDTSQMYLQFLMLHACSYTICFEFCSRNSRRQKPNPWPRPPMVRPPGPPPDDTPLPIKYPWWEKPKGWTAFPRNILQAAAVVETRSGGSRSSSQHPAGGLLHHHGRLQSDVWVVYLGLRVHSSS